MTAGPGAAAGGCPRTGRTRAAALAPGATRPSDALTTFLAFGVAWLTAAALTGTLAAMTQEPELWWLSLHFAFVGGISQLIVGAAQFFACAFLATEGPSRATVRVELGLWNSAIVVIAVGVPTEITALTGVGGSLVLAALCVFAHALRQMRRRSLQRAPWATRWYITAAAFLACGAALGPVMARDVAWTHGSLLGAHLVLNVGGWFGTAIVGTLHTFYPSLSDTRLRHPRLQAPTYAAWTAGVVVLAASAALNSDPGAVLGWAALLVAATMLATNLLSSARAGKVRTPGAVVVSVGQVLLMVAVAAGLGSAFQAGSSAALVGTGRATVAALFVGGWIGLTVAGSLIQLLTVMERVRLLPARPPHSRFDAAATGGTGTVAFGLFLIATGTSDDLLSALARTLLVIGYAVLLTLVVILALRAVRAAPLRV